MRHLAPALLLLLSAAPSFATTFHYVGEARGDLYIYPYPGFFDQLWNPADLTATLNTDTGEFSITGTARPLAPAPRLADWYSEPLTVDVGTTFPVDRLGMQFSDLGLGGFYSDVDFERHIFTNSLGDVVMSHEVDLMFDTTADFSQLRIHIFMADQKPDNSDLEGGLTPVFFDRVDTPEPMTAALLLLGVPLIRRRGRS